MKKCFIFICLLSVFQFCSCSTFVKNKIPYGVQGDLSTNDSNLYDFLGLNLCIKNNSEKTISKVTVVFYVFDENGEPPYGMQNHIVLTIGCQIKPNEILEDCFSLDKYVYSLESMELTIDYLYVSKIEYDDGSEWCDPFGANVIF